MSLFTHLPRRPQAGVKIALTAAHFHGFGVDRQGPWITVEKLLRTLF